MRQYPVPTLLLLGFAVLVVGAAGFAPVATAADGEVNMSLSVVSENGTVEYLNFQSEQVIETERTKPGADISSALALERTQVRASIDEHAFVRSFEAADTDVRRLEIVNATIDRLIDRGAELREDRNRAVRLYNREGLTTRELLTRLAVYRATSLQIREQIDRIESLARERDGFSLPPDESVRLSSVRAQLVSLDGPVTERLTSALRGAQDPRVVYLQTADSGVSLADIDDNTFAREVTDWAMRVENQPNQFADGEMSPLAAAYQRAQTVYPWAFDNRVSVPSISGFGDTAIYSVAVNHAQGDLETYFDGRSTDVFYERQRLRMSALPTDTIATNQTDAIRVTVNETTAIGPIQVSVTEPDTDVPVPATVSAGEQVLGPTGGDGELWLVGMKASETLTVRTNDGDVATVSLSG